MKNHRTRALWRRWSRMSEAAEKARIFVVLGHPRAESFGAALAEAYVHGAESAGASVRFLRLNSVEFDPDVTVPRPQDQPLEPGLEWAVESMEWAQHIVFVFPTWWATMPARLKGFLDRVLLPGRAFREDDDAPTGYVPLLNGRSAQLITTMDSPRWVYRFLYGRPGELAMRRGTLGFCGIRPVDSHWVTKVKESTRQQRQEAIDEVRELGLAAVGRIRQIRRRRHCLAWLKITRLQFYAMTLLSYGLGVAAATEAGGSIAWPLFMMGFCCLFLVEFASVMANEVHDQETDRLNRNAGPFTGGSQVLVRGELDEKRVRSAGRIALVLAGGLAMGVVGMLVACGASLGTLVAAGGLLLLGFVLGPGYTAPPLRLVYRGLGEWVVSFTHSTYMILCGWVIAGGQMFVATPWVLSVPIFLAVLASITLASIPDQQADERVGKRTLAVMLTPRWAALIALVITLAAGASGFLLLAMPLAAGVGVGLHAALVVWLLLRYLARGAGCRRIDLLLFVSLQFVLWFCIWPLLG